MLRNYLMVSIRNLLRNKLYAFINVLGLSVGVASCILIALFVHHEWTFDAFHEHADSIYRILTREVSPEGKVKLKTYHLEDLGSALDEAFEEVTATTRWVRSRATVSRGESSFNLRVALVDSTFFQMFTFPLLVGDSRSVLTSLDNVVITEETHERLFGDRAASEQAIGERIGVKSRGALDLQVSGVMAMWPRTSSLRADLFISFTHWESFGRNNDWGSFAEVFVLTAPGTNRVTFESALQQFAQSHLGERISDWTERGRLADREDAYRLQPQPMREIHLFSDFSGSYLSTSDPVFSYVLAAVGVLILLIANINFATLAIGLSVRRSLEVGVRKVMGARSGQVLLQFGVEGLLIGLIALMAGVAFAELFLPEFNRLARTRLAVPYGSIFYLFLAVPILAATIGLVAGSYPAVVLSRVSPARVFRGGQAGDSGRGWLSRSLVVLQYVISIFLIVCTGVMFQQLDYLQTKPLGYDNEQVIIVSLGGGEDRAGVGHRLKQQLTEVSGLADGSLIGHPFSMGASRTSMRLADGTLWYMREYLVDAGFFDVLDIQVKAGRVFDAERPTDAATSIVVNEALVKKFGWEEPVGQRLKGYAGWGIDDDPLVIGVVEDFHFSSLRTEVEPVVLHNGPDRIPSNLLVRFEGMRTKAAVDALERVWERVQPDVPFRHWFLDEKVGQQYQDEERTTSIIGYAAGLAIFIACLGLLGMTSLSVARRRKEIGVRKVFGATVAGLLGLLTSSFVRLILVASLVAWPLAWFAVRRWLETFAYHCEPGILAFGGGALLTFVIAMASTFYMTLRATRTNPVDSLRYE